MKINRTIVFFAILLVSAASFGQVIPYSDKEIKESLEKKGLTEAEVEAELKKNGFTLADLADASPEEIITIQTILERLEMEKKTSGDLEPHPVTNEPSKFPEIKIDIAKPKTIVPGSVPADSLKSDLFGHEYINVQMVRPEESRSVNESYILGGGDVISVSIWSADAQFDKSFTVNTEGYIRLGDARQRVFVRGLKLSEAREKVKSRLHQFYRFAEGDFNLTLETARKINISIFGEIKNPGAYSFSATYNVLDALRLTGGMNENASVRTVRIIQADGTVTLFDLYAYLKDPGSRDNPFMQDGDIIHVPFARNIVRLSGAVRRSARFEILPGEGLQELFAFAGGFSEDANINLIQVERFTDEEKEIHDISWQDGRGAGFSLQNGDIITVRSIGEEAENFVVVQGEVVNPGRYQRLPNMRISDLITLARIKPESKTDFAFLKRKTLEGTSTYLRVNLDKIIANGSGPDNLLVANRDTLTIWARKRFVDDGTISVTGAIRYPGTYNYDYAQKMHVADALVLAGGLRRDASSIAIIHRADPLKPNEKQYIRINLNQLDTAFVNHENVVLKPFDEIEVLSENLFTERTTVKISGPVNHPGEFQYGKGMKLKDLIILAGGFKMGASTRNIEISRVLIRENTPTVITIANVDFEGNLNQSDTKGQIFLLEPYDHVKVRYVPEFELQRDVEIIGEVSFPGIYSLANKNTRISELIRNAGGLTVQAFPEGATLYRKQDSLGYIVLQLSEALQDDRSKFNYILKHGDIIEIPKLKDFVTIRGATKANEIYSEKMVENPHGINVPYHESKDAAFYIHKYTGGISEKGSWKEVFVEHPNGEIEKTKSFLFFRHFPKVRKGSVIKVGRKPVKPDANNAEKKDTDWSQVISDSLAQAMTIFTLILLAKQASN